MQMQIIFVAGIGILGVLMIVGAILLLNKEESPAQRDKKVKNQIMAEMLDSATSDEERQRIMDMMDADQIDAAFGNNENFLAPQEEKKLYGIDTESGDMLDIIIAKQLQQASFDNQSEQDIFNNADKTAENEAYKSGIFAYDNINNLEETMVIERKEISSDDMTENNDTEEQAEEIAFIAEEEPQTPEQDRIEETTEQAKAEEEILADEAAAEGEDNNEGENNPA